MEIGIFDHREVRSIDLIRTSVPMSLYLLLTMAGLETNKHLSLGIYLAMEYLGV